MEVENEQLNRKVNNLSRQVQALLASQSKPTNETLSPTFSIPSPTYHISQTTPPPTNTDPLSNLPESSLHKLFDLLMDRLQQRVESDSSLVGTTIPAFQPQNSHKNGDESMDSHLTLDEK